MADNREEKASAWHERHVETGFYSPVTYLLIDNLFVAQKEGVRRVLCKPQKHSEPVFDFGYKI